MLHIIESRYNLLAELRSLRVIREEEYSKLQAEKTVYKCNELLLNYLVQASDKKCENFLNGLVKTDQLHVANVINKQPG